LAISINIILIPAAIIKSIIINPTIIITDISIIRRNIKAAASSPAFSAADEMEGTVPAVF
jgi:hypothetical protein